MILRDVSFTLSDDEVEWAGERSETTESLLALLVALKCFQKVAEWRDPDTGYLRRQLSTPRFPVAVTEVVLPAGARVPYPAGAYAFIAQLVWVLSGRLILADGPDVHELSAGDTFELGESRPREFRNDAAAD